MFLVIRKINLDHILPERKPTHISLDPQCGHFVLLFPISWYPETIRDPTWVLLHVGGLMATKLRQQTTARAGSIWSCWPTFYTLLSLGISILCFLSTFLKANIVLGRI